MPTVEQWRSALDRGLEDRRPEVKHYQDYYDGDHRLQFATSKFKEAFGELFEAFATNWCGLVVDVAVERLEVLGFRFGEDDADDEAWTIWQANGLDARSISAHTEAVKTACSYLLVGPPREPSGEPVITVESPDQMIVAHDPADRRRRLAAAKKWRHYDGAVYEQVFTPEQITTFRQPGYARNLQVLGVEIVGHTGEDWEVVAQADNPLGLVPAVPLENAPDLVNGGRSDLKPAIALNDAANKFFTDMIHASEFTSFPQRVLTGVEIPRDPITNEPLDEEQLRAAVSRLWVFEGDNAKAFQLSPGELGQYVEGVDLAIQHLAAQTRTPPHYLLAKLVNLSGDALVAAETGLVARCKRKHIDFSDPWEEAMRIAFRWRSLARRGWAGTADDAARAEMIDAETIWADPEHKDPVSLSQSLSMKSTIGVPQEVLWEEAGYTPQQIKRMRKLRDEEMKRQQELADAQAAAGGEDGQPALSVGVQPQGNQLAVTGLPGPEPKPEPANA